MNYKINSRRESIIIWGFHQFKLHLLFIYFKIWMKSRACAFWCSFNFQEFFPFLSHQNDIIFMEIDVQCAYSQIDMNIHSFSSSNLWVCLACLAHLMHHLVSHLFFTIYLFYPPLIIHAWYLFTWNTPNRLYYKIVWFNNEYLIVWK